MSKKKFAVILSGAGVFDGTEINEVVLTQLSLACRQIDYQCFAPDIDQFEVIDHLTGKTSFEKRNVLSESARIVRGDVLNLKECNVGDYDALIVPGGFGVAKNLSNFASMGELLEINADVFAVLNGFKIAKKPVGYLCIAPVLLPCIYGSGVILTIGNDLNTIAIVERLGGTHKVARVDEIVIDFTNKVVTTPAYMLASNIYEASLGIDKLVAMLNDMS